MFDISKLPLVKVDLNIPEDVVLDYYDGPILYYGRTKGGKLFIAVLINDDRENKCQYFLYAEIKQSDLDRFLNGSITFRYLLRIAIRLYLHKSSYGKKNKIEIYKISFKDIPEDYLPTRDSYMR